MLYTQANSCIYLLEHPVMSSYKYTTRNQLHMAWGNEVSLDILVLLRLEARWTTTINHSHRVEITRGGEGGQMCFFIRNGI